MLQIFLRELAFWSHRRPILDSFRMHTEAFRTARAVLITATVQERLLLHSILLAFCRGPDGYFLTFDCKQ